jgi:hypothetical protein
MYIASNGDIYDDEEIIFNDSPEEAVIHDDEIIFIDVDELILRWERNLRL